MSVEQTELSVHYAELPRYLQGLQMPATTEDALQHAEEHGAAADALAFIEALPAAVFASEDGMRRAFAATARHELPRFHADDAQLSEDGDAS